MGERMGGGMVVEGKKEVMMWQSMACSDVSAGARENGLRHFQKSAFKLMYLIVTLALHLKL